MSGKIPVDAFDYYVALGASRSYQAVADRYGVSKRAVVKRAMKDHWAERLVEIQAAAKVKSDQDLANEVVEVRDRHKRMLKAMAVRALSGLKDLPLRNGMEAIRAAELVIRMERIVFGGDEESGEASLEEITKREIQTLLIVDGGQRDEEVLDEEASVQVEEPPGLTVKDSMPPLGDDPNAMPLFPREPVPEWIPSPKSFDEYS